MNEIKKYWKFILGGLLVLCLLPVALYTMRFVSSNLSNDPNYWGIFGNYLGGVLSPFLSLINIIVLGYLTYTVAKHGDSSKLNDFRYKAYIELITKLDTIKEDSITVENINSVEHYLKSFCFNNLFLFKDDLNIIFQHCVANVTSALIAIRIELQVREQTKDDFEKKPLLAQKVLEEISNKDMREYFDKFLYEKFSLIGFIQTVMTGGNTKPYKT